MSDDSIYSVAGKFLLQRIKYVPEAFIVAVGVMIATVILVLPSYFGAKADVAANKLESRTNHKLVVKALCENAQLSLNGQEQSIQNEIYSLEQALYQVERYVEEGTATPRDRNRRDQLKIQLQRLQFSLHKVQAKENYIPDCQSSDNTASSGGGGVGGG